MQQIKGISRKGGYEIGQSLLFDGVQDLARTATASDSSDRTKSTLSFWIKNSAINQDTNMAFIGWQQISLPSTYEVIDLRKNKSINWRRFKLDTLEYRLATEATYRDPSAWTHFVFKYDSTGDGTGSMIYQNGEPLALKDVKHPDPNDDGLFFADNNPLRIGAYGATSAKDHFYGYLSEFHAIDGQALGPEHFALTDSNGVNNPIPYTGTYGTNGF